MTPFLNKILTEEMIINLEDFVGHFYHKKRWSPSLKFYTKYKDSDINETLQRRQKFWLLRFKKLLRSVERLYEITLQEHT